MSPPSVETPDPESRLLGRFEAVAGSSALAVVDQSGGVSFSDLCQAARHLSRELGRAGLSGQRVALACGRNRNWLIGFWAILLGGGTVVPLIERAPPAETEGALRRSKARAVLASPDWPGPDSSASVDWIGFDAGRLLDARGPRVEPSAAASSPARAPALLLFTSGTTGQPKGVPLSHDNVIATIDTLGDDWGIGDGDRLVHALPLHHLHGICVALLNVFCAGGTTELLPRHRPEEVLEAASRASVLMGVPTQHQMLVQHVDGLPESERASAESVLSALRLVTSGSSKLPEKLGRRMQALTGRYPLERYGMTEVGIVIGNPLDAGRRPGSCGRPLPGCDVRIVSETGEDVGAGEAGEIWIRAASVFSGYDGDARATREAFAGDFFKSGDTATWAPGGFVEILGRTSVDIIKSGGEKLSAIEMEEQLRSHPWVADVAVVGVPDETWGQRAVAVVVPSPSAPAHLSTRPEDCAEELRAFMKGRVSAFKVPKRIAFRKALPRNALGKVQKHELARQLA